MVTNVATALIGIGDMWVVGRLEDAAAQGAVDVGARLFAVLFTVMNFLKTGTTGLVAQEGTRSGSDAQAGVLLRGLAVGLAIAVVLLAVKPFILPALLGLLGAQGDVLAAATTYAEIRYWSAPAVMANLALVGFMIGRRQMTAVLIFEVAYNLLNIGLGLLFVLVWDFGIAGIGWSSFIAEYAKLLAVAIFLLRGDLIVALATQLRERANLRWRALAPFLSVNRDLFLRTVVLMIALAALTRLSAERGTVVLAANGIIYQMFVFTALLLDGFENSAQVLNGERFGARDRAGFNAYLRATMVRGFAAAAMVAGLFALFAEPVLSSFAATEAVAEEAHRAAYWLILIPFAGVAGFIFDGVFVGASWTRALLLSMAGSSVAFAALLWVTWPMGNGGLWLSFTLFLVIRALLQLAMLPRLVRDGFD
uniref:MATE family efflux transporter n=1 Tax=Parerythrobacter lutipelagi TaxID=1964208 RepID=UPI0010F673D6|nr:MATE family efflux transporter [Parerythrobacter lutipelagi]